MAKQKSKVGKFTQTGWQMSVKLFNDFVLITDKNRKEILVLGRIIYYVEIMGERFRQYNGFFEVNPRLSKCRLNITNHMYFPNHSVWISSTESMEEYQKRFSPLEKLIGQGKMYYRPTDEIVKYSRT